MSAIAIVGMGCRFAAAPDLQAYWNLMLEGRDAFTGVPPDRWDEASFFDANKRATDKSYAPKGAFIEDIRSFPALAFGLPPRRVEVMDPQHRFALEVSLQAIEDAGYAAADMPRRTGVYMGVTATEYRTLMSSRVIAQMMATGSFGRAPADPSDIVEAIENVVPSRPFTAPGALGNMTAATVAQELDLHGPAYTVDAACASALIAVADAVAQLRAGSIDAAVAGGVYLCVTPDHHIAFSRIGAMSASGRCLPFDARADGFIQGDGAGAVVLKRLEDALRDGDRVYAVINGIATNNDGRGDGPMAPLDEGQRDVILDAWADARLDPEGLGYVEAHGTGTDIGDVTELRGLKASLGAARHAYLGSSKANIGHTMSAAGVAGLIRAALAVHHRIIPPMAGFEGAKPDLGLEGSPFSVPTAPVAWEADRRLAGVSSFGFGGTNAHAVLSSAETTAPAEGQAELVLLSAPSDGELRALCARTADAAERDPHATVAGVARAWARKKPQRHRLGLVARTRTELVEKLRAVAQGQKAPGARLGEVKGDPPKVAFLFPGQGSQRPGMMAGIRDRFPVVAETLDELEAALAADLPLPLGQLLYPERRAAPVDEDTARRELTDTAVCQPALLACGVALARLLADVGVHPHVVTGHSLGEFTAASVAGVLSASDAARFVAARGRQMAALPGDHGAMAAVMTDADEARRLLPEGAVLANLNHPRQVVVSGATQAIAEVVRRAEAADIKAVQLEVSHGFHSPVLGELDVSPLLDAIHFADPQATVASGIAPRPYADAADARAVFARHAVSPVDFVGALSQCTAVGADLYLQVGAGGPLASFARGSVSKGAVFTLASLDDADGGASLLETLAQLFALGVPVDVSAITARAPVASVPPSLYPRQVYWAIKDEAQLALNVKGARAARPAPAPQKVAVPTPEPIVASSDPVLDRVLGVVAKVSAWPKDALKPAMTLIDDLGFDSLMVGDLATGLADAFPGLDGIPQELLINRPTVADIVEYARTAGQRSESAGASDDAPLGAWRPVWRAAPLPAFPVRELPKGATALVIGGAPSAVAALEAAGVRVATETDIPVDLVVYALGEPVPVGAVLAGEVAWPDHAEALIAALDRQAALGRTPDLIVLHRDGDPWAAGAAGVVRSVAREWPNAVAKVIAADDPAAVLVAEWRSADRTVDVRYTEGRQVLGLEPVTQEPAFTPGPNDTVLVTGGTRGIGAKLAERLAAGGSRVLLLGRGDLSDEAARLCAQNPKVVQVRADVTDRAALVAALAGEKVTVLVHSAGVLADGPLGKVAPAAGAAARAVKVGGFLNALAASGPSLKVALGVGSWAGRFGNRHQAHYAAANALLAAIADAAPAKVRAVVGEFGPWSSSEMVRTIPAPVQAAMKKEGVDFVGDAAGLDALLNDLAGGRGAVVHGRDLAATTRVIRTTTVLSTATHPYLLDHAIEGTPILPMAAAADLLAWAACAEAPFALDDVRLFAGVTVKEPVKLTLSVRGDRAELRTGERQTLAWRARIRPTEAPTDPGPRVGGAAPTRTVAEFYDFTFHGPKMAGITAIDGVGEDFVRGRVRTSRPAELIPGSDRPAWQIDPLAFDSAMQLSAYVAWTRFGRAGTPVGIGRYAQLRPLPAGEVIAEVAFGAAENDRFSGTIRLRGEDGTLLAVAEDVVAELRQVEGAEPPIEIKPEWVDPAKWPALMDLDMRLQGAALIGVRNPYFAVHEGTAKNVTTVAGRELVNYSSYNYLGLSGDPRVLADVGEAVARYGTSVSASRVASGERPFHGELERLVARCQGAEDALLFTAGHATNVTTIGHMFGPDDLILHDELIHDSALQGIKLAGAARRAFKHDDPDHLRKQLEDLRRHYKKVLIVVEGVYSMDGDICDLPAYVAIKERHGCLLMVDEAHSFGIIGATGQGAREHFGIAGSKVDVWMGTLSKSLASCGGWVAGSAPLIRYLRYTAPGFVYSAGLTPANGQAALSSLKLMLEEPWRVAKLQENARVFHGACQARGLDNGPAKGGSAVVPVVTGNSMHALLLSQRLQDQGVNVQPIVYPAVADDAARLRFFLSSLHTEEQLVWTANTVADTLEGVRREFPIPG